MRFKTTLVLLAVLVLLIAVVLYFDSRGEKKKAAEETSNTLISLTPGDVRKVSLVRDGRTLTFERDEAGPWRLTSPIQAAADEYEVDGLVSALTSLRIERVVDGNVNSRVHRLFDGCDGERRLRCDPACELEDRVLQLSRRYHRVDQAEGERPLGVDRVARQQQLRRRGAPDQPRQPLGSPPTGDDAELDLGLAESGVTARDPQVA